MTDNEVTTDEVTTNVADNPAVETAKRQAREETSQEGTVLSTGVRVRLHSVSASLIDEVRSRIKDPDVPIFHDEEKGREMPNPADPVYLRQLGEAEDKRNKATTDAMVMFGVELLDGLPKDDKWIHQLKFLGIEVDSSDSLAMEFAYKKYKAVGTPDLPLLYSASAVTEQEVERAMRGFQRDEEGGTDT